MLLSMKQGLVKAIIHEDAAIQEIEVLVGEKAGKAVNYKELTGAIAVGDNVLLNTGAVELSLGTGGSHFVIANLNNPATELDAGGHMMKMRYSPYQIKVWCSEEPDRFGTQVNDFKSLAGMPVICAELHSQIGLIAAGIKSEAPGARIAYLMSDGAALPIAFSQNVKQLKKCGLINDTITFGHAFGGDHDAVSIYSALAIASSVCSADACIISMGPGIAGTGTTLGHTGTEVANHLNAVQVLGGLPISALRVSFADKRERHYGISHHTMTVLSRLVLARVEIAIPLLQEQRHLHLLDSLECSGAAVRHNLHLIDAQSAVRIAQEHAVQMKTMGRGYEEEKEFFHACGAAGILAGRLVRRKA